MKQRAADGAVDAESKRKRGLDHEPTRVGQPGRLEDLVKSPMEPQIINPV
jgi:hypothetical protein